MVLPHARHEAQHAITLLLSPFSTQGITVWMSVSRRKPIKCSMWDLNVRSELGDLVAPLRCLQENWISSNFALVRVLRRYEVRVGKAYKKNVVGVRLPFLSHNVASATWFYLPWRQVLSKPSNCLVRRLQKKSWNFFPLGKMQQSSWSMSLLWCCQHEWVTWGEVGAACLVHWWSLEHSCRRMWW